MSALAASIALLASCDSGTSPAPQTVTKEVYDTIYMNDRFALNAPVIDGRWVIRMDGDSADAWFSQDKDTVSAIFLWAKQGTPWTLKGTVSRDSISMVFSGGQFYGAITDSTNRKKSAMKGNYLATGRPTSIPSWTANRRN